MNNEVLFSEQQRFRQWWYWAVLIGVNALFLFGVFQQIVVGQQFGDNPMSDSGLIISTVLMIFTTFLLLSFRLDTQIKTDGVYVRFFPFHIKFKHYVWESLEKSYVRQYAAIAEYGGWGLRFGFGRTGTAYNISGNKGLQLEFKTGKRLLIGTNKAAELTEILREVGQLKE
jgi:hypothetical protein